MDWFQFRRPDRSDRDAYREARAVRRMTRACSVTLIVNDRPDLALAVGADGVHLGTEDLPPGPVKQAWPSLTVGATQRAADDLVEGVDYYGVGPVHGTSTKIVEAKTCGWEGIRAVLDQTDSRVVAIGGIDVDNLEGAPEGLGGVAVTGAVWDRPNPTRAVRDLRRALDRAT